MLQDWMTTAQREQLTHARARRQPHAESAFAAIVPSLFDSVLLHCVLSSEPAPDALVVAGNQLLNVAVPRTAAQMRELLQRGSGLVVRHAQAHSETLRSLSRRFSLEYRAEAHIQLFVTPAATQGFGWHYDADDVIILQTRGSKDYYMRQNTLPSCSQGVLPMDFSQVRQETSPVMKCTLLAGGALYLPRGMWHAAKAIEESFSISIGLEQRARTAHHD